MFSDLYMYSFESFQAIHSYTFTCCLPCARLMHLSLIKLLSSWDAAHWAAQGCVGFLFNPSRHLVCSKTVCLSSIESSLVLRAKTMKTVENSKVPQVHLQNFVFYSSWKFLHHVYNYVNTHVTTHVITTYKFYLPKQTTKYCTSCTATSG